MHEASALIAGASVEAARRVWTGQAPRAVNVSGGLHHAMPGNASGFCIYNDIAVAIDWLLDHGAQKVAYVDVDAHHGDGVQKMFWDDPRVLTVSIHEGPQTLFPGTGYSTEVGGEGAEGSAVNVPLPPGTSDAGWLRAFHAVGAGRGARVRPRHLGHAARLRLAHGRPADQPDAVASTASARRTWRCAISPRRCAAASGSPPAVAGTPSWTSCRGRGRTCCRSSRATRWIQPR